MSTDRVVPRLLRWYPRTWRSRYGAELETLIVDMCEDGSVPWVVRLNVAGAGARERLVSAFGGRQQKPEARLLGGTLLVLWAWTLFVVGGSIVGKSAEHWSDAVPGGPSSVSTAAYGVLTVGAVGSAVLVLAGVGCGLRQFVLFLRAGGWPQIRRRVLIAGAMSLLTAGATLGLVGLAGSMDQAHAAPNIARVAFLGWAGLGAACLCSWTAAASATARRLELSVATLRGESWLASAVASAMTVMTVATALWWVSVARVAPGALTGGSSGQAAVVPALGVALALMVLATALAAEGARRALTAQRALPEW